MQRGTVRCLAGMASSSTSFNPHPPLRAGATCRPLSANVPSSCHPVGFNPHPPLRAGATRWSNSATRTSNVFRFQSSPAAEGGCNRVEGCRKSFCFLPCDVNRCCGWPSAFGFPVFLPIVRSVRRCRVAVFGAEGSGVGRLLKVRTLLDYRIRGSLMSYGGCVPMV